MEAVGTACADEYAGLVDALVIVLGAGLGLAGEKVGGRVLVLARLNHVQQ